MKEIVLLFLSLLAILASAEIFTNGIECLGRRLSLSQAVVGSILAAVGTALPETILPFVAIFLHSGEASQKIGVGAILGAPFMLATLAFFLVGLTAIICFLRKKRPLELRVEIVPMKRDLIFFIAMYSSAIFMPMVFHGISVYLAFALIGIYFYYAYKTFRGESSEILHAEDLYLKRLFDRAVTVISKTASSASELKAGIVAIVSQVLFALAIMIGSAHIFVDALSKLSASWGIDPMLFALLAAPVATELPEKFNSVTWTIKGRDTLALGNITGAMVFQSTFPVALGLLFTSWDITGLGMVSAIMAIIISLIVLANLHFMKRLSPFVVLLGALFYGIYALLVVTSR